MKVTFTSAFSTCNGAVKSIIAPILIQMVLRRVILYMFTTKIFNMQAIMKRQPSMSMGIDMGLGMGMDLMI